MAKEKWTIGRIIKWFMIIAGIISILSGLVYYLIDQGKKQQVEIEFKKDLKDVTFEDKTQRDKAIDYVNSDFTPLSVFFQSDTLGQKSDTLDKRLKETLTYQKKLDTILNDIYQQRQEQHLYDSIENVELKKNRAKKYEVQKQMLNKLEDIDLRQRDFKKELQKIKDSL